MAPSPPHPQGPQPAAPGLGGGPYLRFDFCVLRRRAAAQAAQKHQQQRQHSRPRRRLPAAEEAARPARPCERAPVAAHALGAQPGPGHCTRGSPARRRRVPARGSETCDAPWLPARRARGSPPGARPRRSRLGPLGKFPRPGRSGQGRAGRAEPARGGGGRPEPPAAGSRSLGARGPAPESKRNSRAFVWLSAPAARSRGAPCAPSSLCPCPGRALAERAPPDPGLCSPRARRAGPPRSAGRRRREPLGASERARGQGAGARRPRRLRRSSGRSRPSAPRRGRAALKGPAPSAPGPGRAGGGTSAGGFWVAGAGRGAGHGALLLFPGGRNPPQPAPVPPILALGERG